MTHDDDLSGIDLQAWRVPPPAPIDRPALVHRALMPAASPRPRAKLAWGVAALAVANAAIAAGVAIAVAPAPVAPAAPIALPAGGDGALEARVNDLLAKLDQKQHALEGELAEIQEMRVLITELAERVRQLEARDHTIAKKEPHPAPQPPPPPGPSELESNPFQQTPHPPPAPDRPCDEVSCVLTNYEGACCLKYRAPTPPSPPPGPSASLDREAITHGIASVRTNINACATGVHGRVKVHVRVAPNGTVSDATVDATPDVALGTCVATAIKTAVFSPSQNGGSFSYPFVF